MPLTPCWPPPVITSISCLGGWSSCCLDSWRLRTQRPPFNGSENRKLHGRLLLRIFIGLQSLFLAYRPGTTLSQSLDRQAVHRTSETALFYSGVEITRRFTWRFRSAWTG